MNRAERQSLIAASAPLWVLFLGHVFASLFLRNLDTGLGEIEDATLKPVANALLWIYVNLSRWMVPVFLILVVGLQVRVCLRRSIKLGVDILGGLLCVRCVFLFVILNMLLISHLKAGGVLLLMQLIFFIPVITINFGWLYWRLDSAARSAGRMHIKFAEEAGTLDPFDYFHTAAMALLQFAPGGASPTSRLMKSLFVIHGAMMLDLVALTLTRAISLTTGG